MKKPHDRNKYLLDKYGITLDRYNEMDELQGHKCKCCDQIPTGKPLHVDHCHKIAGLKIKTREGIGEWFAWIPEFGLGPDGMAKGGMLFTSRTSLEDVKKIAKRWLLAKSVRGLVCWRCNEGMRCFKNRPDVCHRAGKHLEDFAISVLA